jgi:hypothetical protein
MDVAEVGVECCETSSVFMMIPCQSGFWERGNEAGKRREGESILAELWLTVLEVCEKLTHYEAVVICP